jgi:antitoxin MazE
VVKQGHIVLTPVKKPKYKLDELLAKVTPENIHELEDFGKPVGKEVW